MVDLSSLDSKEVQMQEYPIELLSDTDSGGMRMQRMVT